MLAVGITGGYASGKTTVTKMLGKLGAKCVSADEIVHALLNSTGTVPRKIVRVFGKGILRQGKIDRHQLGKIIFSDPLARKTLERILHPAVIKDIQTKIRVHRKSRFAGVLVVEVPLLFETGLEKQFDLIMAVIATRPQQISRAIKARTLTRQEINHRIKAQLPLSQKKRLADIVVDNRGSFHNTQRQVKQIWQTVSRRKSV